MFVIVIQGMSGLGKTSLCKRLEKDLPRCKSFSLDTYKERLWDKFGFDNEEEKAKLDAQATDEFYADVHRAAKFGGYSYILLDNVFIGRGMTRLERELNNSGYWLKTVYLNPTDYVAHKEVWEVRAHDFSVRHPGHGAKTYHNGVGTGHTFDFRDVYIRDRLPVIGDARLFPVRFKPYQIPYGYIKDFILDLLED